MKTCLTFERLEQVNDYYKVYTNSAEINIYFMTDDIVRIRASFDKKFKEESYILTMTGWEDRLDSFLGNERKRIKLIAPSITEDEQSITFSTHTVDLVLAKNPIAIKMLDKNGIELYSDIEGKAYQLDHLNRIYHYNKMKPTDCFYGFGEKTGDINKNGRYMRFSPKDNLGYNPKTGDPLYKHIPMYIRLDSETQKAVGLFYHNTYEAAVSMGDEISGYWPRYTYYVADGGDIDYFLINGPKISDVISRYTDLTGKTVMQPKGSLGYIGSTMYYSELPENCDDEIVAFVDKSISEDIPIDAYMLSSGFTSDEETNKRNVFTWNKKRFPNPKDFFKRMNEKGVMVSPNVKPGVLENNPHYTEMKEQGVFVKNAEETDIQPARWWGGTGAYYDFTNPKARENWINYLTEQIIEMGTVSVWNDNCEYDGIDDRLAVCDFDGQKGTLGQLKCIQSTLMSLVSHIAVERVDKNARPFVVCRSGSSGIQRYAQTWAGDNSTSFDTLKYNIATLLGLGLSGVANIGADNGGFHGPAPNPELLVRWIQNGIFQPRFSVHSCNSDNTVTEPWMYSGHTKYIRDAIKLRYSLVPYLYSLLREANIKGSPIMRPTFYEFQNDRNCYNESVDFMIGPYLLVANIVEEGATSRSVYLPEGSDWYDYYTRKLYKGGQTITIPVDIGSIPMFIREGAIIPTTQGINCIQKQPITKLNICIAPKIESSFELYEDDGETRNYENGEYLSTKISVKPGENIYVDFEKTGRYKSTVETVVLDVINKEKGPFWVSVNNKNLNQFLHRDKWEAAEEGWYYSHTLKSVLVKYKEVEGNYRVNISFEKFDLIGM